MVDDINEKIRLAQLKQEQTRIKALDRLYKNLQAINIIYEEKFAKRIKQNTPYISQMIENQLDLALRNCNPQSKRQDIYDKIKIIILTFISLLKTLPEQSQELFKNYQSFSEKDFEILGGLYGGSDEDRKYCAEVEPHILSKNFDKAIVAARKI